MKIENIKVKRVLDSRGDWTIEVEIENDLSADKAGGIKGKASIPSGKSRGSYEAICLSYEEIQKNLPEFLKEIKNLDFKNSKEFDEFLIRKAGENKTNLGANFALGLSISFARILAKKEGLELWEYLRKEYTNDNHELSTNKYTNDSRIDNTRMEHEYKITNDTRINKFAKNSYDNIRDQFVKLPGLIINLIGGGVHSKNNLDFQEYWLVTRTDANNTRTNANDSIREGSRDSSQYFAEYIEKILEIIKKLEKELPKPLGRNNEGAFSTNFSDNYAPFLYLKRVITNDSRINHTNESRIEKHELNTNDYTNETRMNKFANNSRDNIRDKFVHDQFVTNSYDDIRDQFVNFELGADIAANQITKLVNWKNIYKKLKLLDVKYLEDPFKEDEFEKFADLRKEGFKVIGDDLTTTNVERLKIALEKNSVDGVIVKPNQIGTILETFEFVKLAKENNLFTIFSHRSGETNDDWIIDLGIAFETDFFKIGPPVQGERVAKYNRLLEIFAFYN